MRSLLVVAALALCLGACRRPGPAERTGERLDNAAENISEGRSPFREKGPLEKAGEEIDDLAD